MINTITIDTIREAQRKIEAIGPLPVFASWDQFHPARPIRIEVGGRTYVGAHPDLWAKVPKGEFLHGPVLLPVQILDLSLSSNANVKGLFLEAIRQETRRRLDEIAADQEPIE